MLMNKLSRAWVSHRIISATIAILLPLASYFLFLFGDLFSSTSWGLPDLFVTASFGLHSVNFAATILLLASVFVFLHIGAGIADIIHDHVHHPKTETFAIFILMYIQVVAFKHPPIFLLLQSRFAMPPFSLSPCSPLNLTSKQKTHVSPW